MTDPQTPKNPDNGEETEKARDVAVRTVSRLRDIAQAGARWAWDFIRAKKTPGENLPQLASDGEVIVQPMSTRSVLRIGSIILAVVFGGGFIWSVAFPLQGAVLAGGQVVVEGNRKTVQHLEGGVIEAILVREGQEVDQGEVLVLLQSTEQRAALAVIDGQLTELYARRARLIADRDNLDEVPAPTGLAQVLALPEFADKLRGQRELFDALQLTREKQVSLLNERITQQHDRIEGLQAQMTSLENQLVLIEDELDGAKTLFEKGYAPKTRVRALERESERLRGERGSRRASISEGESVIAEAKLEIERIKGGVRQEAIAELRDTEVKIAELEERRIAAAEAFARTEVKAPQDGWVLGLQVHTVGGVIAPGAPLMDIVPGGDRLQIAVRVAPQHIDQIHQGQETLMRFTSLGSRRTPELVGSVHSISADSIIDQDSNSAFYLAMIDLPTGIDIERALYGHELLPGMPVEAYIKTGKRSAISYLLKPLGDAFSRAMRED